MTEWGMSMSSKFYMKIDRIQVYLEWIKDKMELHLKADECANRKINRGDVYICNLGRCIGSEQEKSRPCVVLQIQSRNDKSPNTIVAPITHTESTLDVVVPINSQYDDKGNLILDGNVLLGNVTTVSKARLGRYITKIEEPEMTKIDTALAISLGLLERYKKLENMYNDKVNHVNNLYKRMDILKAENLVLKKQIRSVDNKDISC